MSNKKKHKKKQQPLQMIRVEQPRARLASYVRLIRLDKPIGSLLLLAPTFIALWIAAQGMPSVKNAIIFFLGVIIMRSAGCIVNDIADRKYDKQVERTKNRPLATGELQVKQALGLLAVLLVLALVLVVQTNVLTVKLSLLALALAACYPLMKRFTHLPQVVLGAAFGMSIPMAFAAEMNQVPLVAYMLFLANLCWVVAYDTQYAMADRAEDMKISVKSTAVLLGDMDVMAIGSLQACSLLALAFIGRFLLFGVVWWLALAVSVVFFVYQYFLSRDRVPKKCTQAFANNQWVGLVWFVGVVLSF